MDFEDLKHKSGKELLELEHELLSQLRELRFKASERQLKNINKLRDAKASYARVKTIQNMRRLNINITAKNNEAGEEKNN